MAQDDSYRRIWRRWEAGGAIPDGDGDDAGSEWASDQQSGAEAAVDAALFQSGDGGRERAGSHSGVSADQQPIGEIRFEVYRRRAGGRGRLLHFQSEAQGAGSRARVFGRAGLGGYG